MLKNGAQGSSGAVLNKIYDKAATKTVLLKGLHLQGPSLCKQHVVCRRSRRRS